MKNINGLIKKIYLSGMFRIEKQNYSNVKGLRTILLTYAHKFRFACKKLIFINFQTIFKISIDN